MSSDPKESKPKPTGKSQPDDKKKVVDEKDSLRPLNDDAQRKLGNLLAYACEALSKTNTTHRPALYNMADFYPQEVFNYINTSETGKITLDEMHAFLNSQGVEFSRDLVKLMWSHCCDLDKDGVVDF